MSFFQPPTFKWKSIPSNGPLSPPAAESTANDLQTEGGFHTADSSILETTMGNVQLRKHQIEQHQQQQQVMFICVFEITTICVHSQGKFSIHILSLG